MKYTHHGLSHTRLDNIYKAMVSRCYHKNNIRYKYYGGKGISVCSDWLADKTKFFMWAHDSGYNDSLTLDRINVDGNYEPNNCRWATYTQQANNKSNSTKIEINGVKHTYSEWGAITGIPNTTIWARINCYKWSPEKAINTPVKRKA